MRRLALGTLLIAVLVAGVIATTGAGGEKDRDPHYVVELDNAFGLVEGGDVKVAGVRAGKITSFANDPKTYRALVRIEIGKEGFGDLRKDVFCETRPQSLIGEYYLDCLPGNSPEKLPVGGRVPVKQTGSTVPVDLINNVYRRPYRERFSIIFGELGAALTARGEDLNETIRRANPALRETNKVLAQLREQRAVIRELVTNANRVVGALADNKTDVGRFIEEARDTSRASSTRYAGLREQFQRFPGFLRELRPTMKLLGEASDRQRSALANLSSNATLLERFLDDLGPFSDASRPAFRSLASTARQGSKTIPVTMPRIKELRAFAAVLPEVVTNLAITLEHLDDRKFAVEKDPRSPGGEGYTGLEALLQYVFRQSQATNVYDGNSYLLKVSAFLDNNCAQYADAEMARQEARQYCRAKLGPNQIGIDNPDPTKTNPATAKARKRTKRDRDGDGRDDKTGKPIPVDAPSAGADGDGGGDVPPLPDLKLPEQVQQMLDQTLPKTPQAPTVPRDQLPLLDFLLGR